MPTICLNMIVKNESHIIAQTLENICQHIALDYWVISDTGSTDNTVEIIEKFFKEKNIQGEIQHQDWVNFGHNRDVALQACVGKSDYILFFDADDHFTGDFKLPALQKDSYFLNMTNESGSTKYVRKLIVKNNGQFFWKGVLHEFLSNKKNYSTESIEGNYTVVSGRKGSRSLDPNKYLKDAQLLEQTIANKVDPDLEARYSFYCAQSYQDAGQTEKAIEWYQKRTGLGDWKEEIYVSFMRLGTLFEAKKQTMQALYYWQCGVAVAPERAECWYHLARRNNWDKNYPLALCYAERAQKIDLPTGNKLFLNKDIYKFWCHYELCINAFQLGYKEQAYTAFKQLVKYASKGLVNRVINQLNSYEDLIKQDSYLNVKYLIQDLKKLGFDDYVNKILNFI